MRQNIVLIYILLASANLFSQNIVWKDSLSDAVVYLHIDEADYKNHPHRKSRAFEVIETDQKFHDKILRTVDRALRKYPQHVLKKHVLNKHMTAIHVYDQFYKGNTAMGTYIGRHGFFFAVPYVNGDVDTLVFERVIHHELSHPLLLFNRKLFDQKAWKNNNALKYGAKYKSDLTLLVFDPNLYAKGFLYSYALTNKWEDFASFAENIFIYQPTFWRAIAEYEPLRNKFEIMCAFYATLDPSLNKDFFLKLNSISLSDIVNER